MKYLLITILSIVSFNTYSSVNSLSLPNSIKEKLLKNKDYVQVSNHQVNRLEIVMPNGQVSTFITEIKNQNVSLEVDGYDDVYMHFPWTARREGFTEYSKLILEFIGNKDLIQSWITNNVDSFKVLSFSIAKSKRGKITLTDKKNPNPVKWFNTTWPVTPNYSANLAGAYKFLSNEKMAASNKNLEVNLPLSTDDLSFFLTKLTDFFPNLKLIEVSPGYEHAFDIANELEFNFPTVRLVFNASEISPESHKLIFEIIEYFHSYKVPVMRFF